MKEEFKIGDIVYLKSGSPAMIVSSTDNMIECTYFNIIDYSINYADFNPILLTKNKPTL